MTQNIQKGCHGTPKWGRGCFSDSPHSILFAFIKKGLFWWKYRHKVSFHLEEKMKSTKGGGGKQGDRDVFCLLVSVSAFSGHMQGFTSSKTEALYIDSIDLGMRHVNFYFILSL